jgi:hypothetical protein
MFRTSIGIAIKESISETGEWGVPGYLRSGATGYI